MVTVIQPTKQQRRELPRWGMILQRRTMGLTVAELARLLDVSETQVYALLKRAREAREKGWI